MARTTCTQFFNREQALRELDELKFAVASLVQLLGKPGSYEQEVGENAARGIKHRLDYVHDSFSRLIVVSADPAAGHGDGRAG